MPKMLKLVLDSARILQVLLNRRPLMGLDRVLVQESLDYCNLAPGQK